MRKPSPRKARSTQLVLEQLEERTLLSVTIDSLFLPDHARQGSTVAISAEATDSDGEPLTFAWNFDDGASVAGEGLSAVTHAFAEPGIYLVELQVSNAAGETDQRIAAITVQDLAALFVTIDPPHQTVTRGDTVTFTGSYIDPNGAVSSEGVAWDMNYEVDYYGRYFTSDITGTLTPAHVFDTAGTYRVALQVTDEWDIQEIVTATVTVQEYEGPVANAGSDLTLSEGETASLSGGYTDADGSVSSEGVAWDFDWDGEFSADLIGTLTPSSEFATAGQYTVALQVTDDHGVADISFLSVDVQHLAPYVNPGLDLEVAASDSVDFLGFYVMAAAVDPADIDWDFNYDGTTFNPNPAANGTLMPTHIYTDPGAFVVALRLTDAADVTQIGTLQVNVTTARPVVDLGPDLSIIQGDTAAFTASITSPEPVTIDWDFNYDGTFEAEPAAHDLLTPSHQYIPADTFHAAARVTNSSGAMVIRTVAVEVTDVPPTADVSSSGPTPEGSPVTFTISNVTDINPDADFDFLVDWTTCDEFERIPDDRRTLNADGSTSFTRVFDDNGTYTVTVRLLDYEGDYTDYPVTAVVTNAPPTAGLNSRFSFTELGPGSVIRFSDVSDPSHADVLAGFTYYYRTDQYSVPPDGSPSVLLSSTDWTSSSNPEFVLPDYTASTWYDIYGYVQDKDGTISSVSTYSNHVGPIEIEGFSNFYYSTGSVLVNGELYQPGEYPGDPSHPNPVAFPLTVVLLDSHAEYYLQAWSFAEVTYAPGVHSIWISLYTTGAVGRGDIGTVHVPTASIVDITAAGSVGTIWGPSATWPHAAFARNLTFQGLTGSITGLDVIGHVDANPDGNPLGWLGNGIDDQVSARRGISSIRAYGIRARVQAGTYFDSSDLPTRIEVADGGTLGEVQAENVHEFESRGGIARLRVNVVANVRQTKPATLDQLYVGGFGLWNGREVSGADGSTLQQLVLGEDAAKSMPQIEYFAVGTAWLLGGFAEDYWNTFKDGKILGWQVHHTKQQALRARYLAELGINVDDVKHLRGVHPDVHSEITSMQNKWRHELMKRMYGSKVAGKLDNAAWVKKFWKEVKWSQVQDIEAKVEAAYSKYWLEANASSKRVKSLLQKLDGEENIARFKLGRGSRMAKLFPKLLLALGIFGVIGENFAFAHNIAAHTPAQQAAWAMLESRYQAALAVAETGKQPNKLTHLIPLKDALIQYLVALEAPDSVVGGISYALEIYMADK